MKRLFLFTLLFSLLVSSKAFSIDVPVIVPTPNPHLQNTIRPLKLITIHLYNTNSEIAINFDSSLGWTTLALKDESGCFVYQETINVTSDLVYYLPIDMLENGNYLLTVTGDNELSSGMYPVIIK